MNLSDLSGHVLAGRFRLGAELGHGGFGAVFEAEQISVGRRCAVKVLSPRRADDAAMIQRFVMEARATSKLAHPNTVVIYDFGRDDETNLLFLAMEYLRGETLDRRVKRRRGLDVETTIHILEQVAASLDDANQAGIVHRDVKPQNIMLIERGDAARPFVKVIDFGIAKALSSGEPERTTAMQLTMDGMVVGTPQYMAPEQIRGEKLDGRTDQYALACVACVMLTQRGPFEAETPIDLASKHLIEEPPRLRELAPELEVSPAFEIVLLRALSKFPTNRFPTARAFVEALNHAHRTGELRRPVAADEGPRRERESLELPEADSLELVAPPAPVEAQMTARVRNAEPPAPPVAPITSHTFMVPAPPEPSADQARHREVGGVRIEGDMPSTDLPDEGGHTVALAVPESTPISTPTPQEVADQAPQSAPVTRRLSNGARVAALIGAVIVLAGSLLADEASESAEIRVVPSKPDPAVNDVEALNVIDGTTGDEVGRELEVAESVSPTVESPPKRAVTRVTTDEEARANAPSKVAPAEPDLVKPSTDPIVDVRQGAGVMDEAAVEGEPAVPEVAESGRVRVTLIPWGELWVDQQNYGTKTRQTIELPAGKHTLRLRQNGEFRVSKTVDVKAGRPTMIVLKAN